MREGHASRTAEYMALFRALESSRPQSTRLFEDPLARAFLSWPLSAVAGLAAVPGLGAPCPGSSIAACPGAVLGRGPHPVHRRRHHRALREQIEQLVILGAGFDCRATACRLAGVSVFEVDHPDTLAIKRSALERASVACSHVASFRPTSTSAICRSRWPPPAIASRRARSFSGKASRTTSARPPSMPRSAGARARRREARCSSPTCIETC